jgi:hypothetical protein
MIRKGKVLEVRLAFAPTTKAKTGVCGIIGQLHTAVRVCTCGVVPASASAVPYESRRICFRFLHLPLNRRLFTVEHRPLYLHSLHCCRGRCMAAISLLL